MTTTPNPTAAERVVPIDGYEKSYAVTSLGRVLSLARVSKSGYREETELAASRNSDGYPVVQLWSPGKRRTVKVHHLVASAFLPKGEDGQMVCHRNGDPGDNRVENLYWGSMRDNMLDAVRHGTHGMARKTHCSRGHEYTPENTYRVGGKGSRHCRECIKIRNTERRMKEAA
jgi:hypothetical protein